MERNEKHTVCRLCLSENGYLIHVLESKGIHGWTAADGICEFLRIQVSADDIYPQSVCFDCMGKLEDFKLFKDRCKYSKQLIDLSYAMKHGIGRNEVESDVSPPFTMTVDDSRVPNEEQLASNGDEEIDPLGDLSDVKPSVTELNNMLSGIKDEPDEVGSNDEVSGELSTFGKQGSDAGEMRECSNPHGPNLVISTTETMKRSREGRLSSRSCCCGLHSPLPHLHLQKIDRWPSLPSEEPKKVNVASTIDHCTEYEESNRQSVSQTAGNGPEVLSSSTTPIEREEHSTWFNVIPSHYKPEEVVTGERKRGGEEESTSAGSDPGGILDRSLDTRVLGPRKSRGRALEHETIENIENGGYLGMEEMGNGRLGYEMDENDAKFRCDSCGMYFSAKSNLRKHIDSHFGEKMCKHGVRLRVEPFGEDPSVGTTKTVDGKTGRSSRSNGITKQCERDICKRKCGRTNVLKVRQSLRAAKVPIQCRVCGGGNFTLKSDQKTHPKVHPRKWSFNCTQCPKRFYNRKSLGKHLKFHSGVNAHMCELCNKVFKERHLLIYHLRYHKGEKLFESNMWKKLFPHRVDRQGWNTGEESVECELHKEEGKKPFECVMCDKRFYCSDALKSHQKFHYGERPFKFHECGMGF